MGFFSLSAFSFFLKLEDGLASRNSVLYQAPWYVSVTAFPSSSLVQLSTEEGIVSAVNWVPRTSRHSSEREELL